MKVKSIEELLRNNDYIDSRNNIDFKLVGIIKEYTKQFIELILEEVNDSDHLDDLKTSLYKILNNYDKIS